MTDLPKAGDVRTAGGHEYVVRRVEEVHGYGRMLGYRVFFDLDGRCCYAPMTLSEWRKLK